MSYCSDLTKERIMECAKAEFLKKAFRQRNLKILLPLQRLQQVQYIVISRIKKRYFWL